jgi:hypothetical protein
MREMTVARYAQLVLLIAALAATAVHPSLGRSIFAMSVLTGALVGSAMTSGTLGGTLAGSAAGIAFAVCVMSNLGTQTLA